jgi:hypothetical protein
LIFFPKNISKIWNTPCEGVVGNMWVALYPVPHVWHDTEHL